jgi:hypothetical protein
LIKPVDLAVVEVLLAKLVLVSPPFPKLFSEG